MSWTEEVASCLPAKPVAMVMRDRFDTFVLSQARTQVRDSTTVVGVVEERDKLRVSTADGQELAARYLLGADGANSVVARALGLRQKKVLGAAIEAEVQVDARIVAEYAQIALCELGAVTGGYLWIFPKKEHLSVGIAVFGKKREYTHLECNRRLGLVCAGPGGWPACSMDCRACVFLWGCATPE